MILCCRVRRNPGPGKSVSIDTCNTPIRRRWSADSITTLVREFHMEVSQSISPHNCPLQKPISQVIRLIGLVVLLESSFAITNRTVTEVTGLCPMGPQYCSPAGRKTKIVALGLFRPSAPRRHMRTLVTVAGMPQSPSIATS